MSSHEQGDEVGGHAASPLELDNRLLHSQKMDSIGTLAGGIAHEFNNILTMILGSAEMLRIKLKGNGDLEKYIGRIITGAERGAAISRQLLVFTRPDENRITNVYLSEVIKELDGMLRHFLPRSIEIIIDISDEEKMILGDSGQIHQALLNLVLNARDAMKNSGTLRIRHYAMLLQNAEQRCGCQANGPYIAVSVMDTGEGISESAIEKIFDPFFTTKERGKGTGLGLWIVQAIMKSHHGFIDVRSEPGKGTTFMLFFPQAFPDAKPGE